MSCSAAGIRILSAALLTIAFGGIAAGTDAPLHWPLTDAPEASVLAERANRLPLLRVKVPAPGVAGVAAGYDASCDMRLKPWTLEGSFRCAAAPGQQQGPVLIAGTRSRQSGYTGWDLMMLNGKLRLMAVGQGGDSATILTDRRFDDGQEHHFSLSWQPGEGTLGALTLRVDRQHEYRSRGRGDLGADRRRRFAIGVQPPGSYPWRGTLRDFRLSAGATSSPASSPSGTAAVLDRELRSPAAPRRAIKWVDAADLTLEGKGWTATDSTYTRLPVAFRDRIRPEVWKLGMNSAGIAVHFTASGTDFLAAEWQLAWNSALPNMTPVGANGLDLYVKRDGRWQWRGIGRPAVGAREHSALLTENLPVKERAEYLIYLPLYTTVKRLKIGVAPEAKVAPATVRKKPLVFYGTSITQGCGASRPGMTYSAILGRRFDGPVVNLGFSGNGTMDEIFGRLLPEIDAAAYVIDCLPNMGEMSADVIASRTVALVESIRRARPQTPVILVEDRPYAYARMWDAPPLPNPRRIGLRRAFDRLRSANVDRLYYVDGDRLIGSDGEATVDGSHPTDLGMFRIAETLEPVLRQALAPDQPRWRLVWRDEFDRPGRPDPATWSMEKGFCRNREMQFYTDRPDNVRVENGLLVIEARKVSEPNPYYRENAEDWRQNRKTVEYTSASLTTEDKRSWRYGRIEVRAKLPVAAGMWPAIWTTGANRPEVSWPVCGEIDIMEYYGNRPGQVFSTVHYAGADRRHLQKSGRTRLDHPGDGFHVYAVEWNEREMIFSLDGRPYYRFEIPPPDEMTGDGFRKPQCLRLNLALGGTSGGVIDDAALPQRFLIDYVRVYQLEQQRKDEAK